jgi:predicted dinucleotide-binding enzyme
VLKFSETVFETVPASILEADETRRRVIRRHAFRHGDDRAAGASVRNAPLELGGLILAQQINPLTQKTPIGEAGRCLSSYRSSLHF